jgi:hypothetical protein
LRVSSNSILNRTEAPKIVIVSLCVIIDCRLIVDLRNVRPRNARARHLVALPVVGTGLGGLRMQTGLVTRRLLPVLYEASRRFGYDVVLVWFVHLDHNYSRFVLTSIIFFFQRYCGCIGVV